MSRPWTSGLRTLIWFGSMASIAFVWYECLVVAASDAQGAIIFLGGLPLLVGLNFFSLRLAWKHANSRVAWALIGLTCLAWLVQLFFHEWIDFFAMEIFASSHFGMNPYEFSHMFGRT